MEQTYGVIWRRGNSRLARGRLELDRCCLRLVGTDAAAAEVVDEIDYADLANVHVGRLLAERIDGRRTVVLERAEGETVSIAGVTEPGAIAELADRLAALQRANTGRRAAIIVPLVPGSHQAVRELLADGPPFDPEQLGFERHEVYVTDDEAVFVFEWRGGASLDALLGESALWERIAAWHAHVAGPPRIAEPVYTWRRGTGTDTLLLPPGLHAAPR